MIIVKIITLALGLAFLLFGYFIYFRRKYSLINGFEVDYQKGRRDEQYAKRIGLLEFMIGIALLVGGIILTILA